MKKLLDLIGSPFVYRSPTNKVEAWRKNAMYMTCRQLRGLTGIRAHYSKAVLISRYINENMSDLK
tara:strand:- start:930 stop:1124 length:195 start_codon:yes stop_codon:yes gene_type:complete